MLLWLTFSVLTALALLFVLRPLAVGAAAGAARREGHDAAVYRDQLREIEADLERGQINAAEAASARAEIARRLLAAAAAERNEADVGTAGSERSRTRLLAGALAAIPIASVALYLALGAPGVPDLPHAARLDAPVDGSDIGTLIAKVEARLRTHPEDGEGWAVVAPVYMRLGRYQDAVDAYDKAVRLLGETPDRLEGLGEARVLLNDGIVGDAARKAFARALALEPERPAARYYLALALEQDGKLEEAAAAYRSLLAVSPADAPWRPTVTAAIARVSGGVAADGAAPGPSAEDVAAAQAMSAEERQAMITQMIAGLAQRLAENGKDLPGWLRLIRAYMVLGDKAAAEAALADARRNFAGDATAEAELAALARSLGLETS